MSRLGAKAKRAASTPRDQHTPTDIARALHAVVGSGRLGEGGRCTWYAAVAVLVFKALGLDAEIEAGALKLDGTDKRGAWSFEMNPIGSIDASREFHAWIRLGDRIFDASTHEWKHWLAAHKMSASSIPLFHVGGRNAAAELEPVPRLLANATLAHLKGLPYSVKLDWPMMLVEAPELAA